jgi:hypothetical protein
VIATTSSSAAKVCRTLEASRATLYRRRCQPEGPPNKRGPKTAASDEELAVHIREVLSETEEQYGFRGEGHRKVRARLRQKQIHAGKGRVLRVMRESGLLAPTRTGRRGTESPNDSTARSRSSSCGSSTSRPSKT